MSGIAGQWFSPSRFALSSGLAMASGMAGGVLGQAPLRLAVEATDWRTTMLLLALGGVALSLAAWAFIRDRWRGSGGTWVRVRPAATAMEGASNGRSPVAQTG